MGSNCNELEFKIKYKDVKQMPEYESGVKWQKYGENKNKTYI